MADKEDRDNNGVKQYERNEDCYGNVTHSTKVYHDDGSSDLYVDRMVKSDEAKYLKDQQDKGYRP